MKNNAPRALTDAINERYQQLVPRIQHLPPTGSRPLTVSGRVAGWVTARATRVLAQLPGVSIQAESVAITGVSAQRRTLNQVLESAARTLQDAGLLRAWRDELLDVIGEGQRLGMIERAAVRPLGMLTRAVHLNAWTSDDKMWIARRAATKSTDPNMWDTLVGGLACARESLDTSLLRESNEEAGLEHEQLAGRSALRTILRMHRRLPEGYQVEDVLCSDCVLDDDFIPRNLDGEVSEFRAVSVDELWSLLEEGAFTLEAELVILDALAQRLDAPGA